jgi:small subunit ribosomal protein S17
VTAGQGKYGGRKVREGTVVSDKMEKTLVVSVASAIRHPLYKKTIRRSKHYFVHDEDGLAHQGDRVRIVEASPVSKLKRWRLAEVLRKVELPEIAPEEIDLELIGEVKPEAEEAAEPEAVAGPAVEAAQPPAAVATPEAAEPSAEDVVQADAGAEALQTPEETHTAESAMPEEPEVPAIEEEEVVQEDAAPEATGTTVGTEAEEETK